MAYYLISFPLFVLGYFTPSENIDAMTNILIFSLGAIFSGVVFGAAFLSVARTLQKESTLRNHMIMAAYGFLLFYIAGSASATRSLSSIWTCFSVLYGVIMLFDIFGLYSSAVTVSQDVSLRHSIRRSVTEQSKLLDSIGTVRWSKKLQTRVLTIAKKLRARWRKRRELKHQ